jgi:hypothetical protein
MKHGLILARLSSRRLRERPGRHSELQSAADSWLQLSYPKARLAAGLRRPWAREAGFEPASFEWTVRTGPGSVNADF